MYGVYLPKRSSVIFSKEKGTASQYNGKPLPDIFEKPLASHLKIKGIPDTGLSGFTSGTRSAIIYDGDISYKIKGCDFDGRVPYRMKCKLKQNWWGSEPLGRLSRDNCLNELKLNEAVSNKYAEFDFVAPLEPRGNFEYGDGTYGAILECSGDARYNEFITLLLNHPELCTVKYLDTISASIAEWVGFNQWVLEKTKTPLSKKSDGFGNYALHFTEKQNHGFGFGRVDFDLIAPDCDCARMTRIKKESDSRMIADMAYDIAVYEAAKNFGITFKQIYRGRCSLKEIFVEQTRGTEKKEVSGDEILLHIKKNRFERIEDAVNRYLDFAKGKEVPEPIGAKLIRPLFSS